MTDRFAQLMRRATGVDESSAYCGTEVPGTHRLGTSDIPNLFEKSCARVGRDFFTPYQNALRPTANNSTTTPPRLYGKS